MQSLTAAAAALQAALLAAALLAAAGARACDVQLNAQHFFDLCEAGKGANATAPYVSPGASFSAQVVDALPGPFGSMDSNWSFFLSRLSCSSRLLLTSAGSYALILKPDMSYFDILFSWAAAPSLKWT